MLLRNVFYAFPQTTEKRRLFAPTDDDDVDVSDGSDGSDFDEDEDPDKIEVPGKNILRFFVCEFNCNSLLLLLGGGRDLETVSKFGKSATSTLSTAPAANVTIASSIPGGTSLLTINNRSVVSRPQQQLPKVTMAGSKQQTTMATAGGKSAGESHPPLVTGLV